MRTEVGSEFWHVPIDNDNGLFSDDVQWFESGRSALSAIIRENNFKTVALPDWCCDSMVKPFVDSGIEVSFYPAFQKRLDAKTDAILLMDYFGYTNQNSREGYQGIVIRDMTHSLFSDVYKDADYYFGSLRKWAGFYTGGFAKGLKKTVSFDKKRADYISLRTEAMQQKEAYILGESDSKEYLNVFGRAEELLEVAGIFPADEEDIRRAKRLDVSFIRHQRRANAGILLQYFSDIAVFPEMQDTECPLFVPILVDNRDALRQHLIQNEIYCPVHWPKSQYHQLSPEREDFYDRELSLVCDQRYTEQDMLRMVAIIREFLDKEE